ncbi:hypothetical protein EVAR_49185_1 [Eumeta japonica]|uniref:Uncharacterized protein n=1 Tax=Eumeta variegata TaxID=151549 RepID=A0A4C1YHX5_EUMVA|nr:hypothetical protein EVAR_49185_1 [Eumeta japonica]
MDDAWRESSRHRMSQETVTGRFPFLLLGRRRLAAAGWSKELRGAGLYNNTKTPVFMMLMDILCTLNQPTKRLSSSVFSRPEEVGRGNRLCTKLSKTKLSTLGGMGQSAIRRGTAEAQGVRATGGPSI